MGQHRKHYIISILVRMTVRYRLFAGLMRKHSGVSLQTQTQHITMMEGGFRHALPLGRSPAYWLRLGRAPVEESSGRAWLPLDYVVTLE